MPATLVGACVTAGATASTNGFDRLWLLGTVHLLPPPLTEAVGALLEPLVTTCQKNGLPAPCSVAFAATIATLFVVALLDVAGACRCPRHGAARRDVVDYDADDCGDDPEVKLTIAMLSAIESDQATAVAAAVERGAPIHGPLRGACGITAPQLAALLGKATALRQLQSLGADLVECHPMRMLGGNCLHGASLGSHTSTTEYLIQESGLFSSTNSALVDLDVPLQNGMTALFLACQAGNIGVVERLAAAKADPTVTRRDGSTCLFISAKNGHHRVVQYLLKRTKAGETLEAKVTKGLQYTGATALWVCCEKGRSQSLQMLLSAGAAAHTANAAGATALMVAADCGQIDAAQQLVSDGRLSLSEVCAKDCNGCDALSFAMDQGHCEIAELIQDHIVAAFEAAGGGQEVESLSPPPRTSLSAAAVVISKQIGNFHGHQPTGLLRGSWRCGVSTDLPTGRLLDETDDTAQFELIMTDYPDLFELLEPGCDDFSPDIARERASVVAAVENSCSQMHGTFLKVQQVYRVNCPPAVSLQYAETVSQLHEPATMHLTNLFHGTNEAAMLSICKHGFDPNHASFRGNIGLPSGGAPKMFGNGLYLATNAVRVAARQDIRVSQITAVLGDECTVCVAATVLQTKSAQMRYTKGSNKLLLCEAVLGNTWSVTQSMPFLTPFIVHAKVSAA